MKNIDPSFTTIKKMVCPFCSFGCEFGVVLNDFGVKGVEYTKEGDNAGRLCPRGSASALYLNHPKRLVKPMKSGKPTDWQKFLKELKQVIAKPQNTVVTFDRNLTLEEYSAITGFCDKTGIKTTASTYLEPETVLRRFLDKPFALTEIEDAGMIVVVGDIFNQTPMLSQPLIKWKLSDRKHRLVVIESINCHTAGFANDFLKTKLGTEPLVLLALAQEEFNGVKDIESLTGVSKEKINEISAAFKKAGKGLLIASLPFAHTYDPVLFAEALAKFSEFSGKRVVPFMEFPGFEGNEHFGAVVELLKKRKIKYLVNFGELFPYYYPQLSKVLKSASIYSASTIKYNGYTMFPSALNLEKAGTIITTFGKKSLTGAVEPASGAKTVQEILSLLGKSESKGKTLSAPKMKVDVQERVDGVIAKVKKERKKKTFRMFGEKKAYNFYAFFEEEKVTLNPSDAEELGLKANDVVAVKSPYGKIELKAIFSRDLAPGTAAVPAETPEVRGLFDFEIKDNIVNFIPTEVEIWRKG